MSIHALEQRAAERRSFPDVASVAMALQPSYPVYCLRPRIIERTAERFRALFPGKVLYAVKCNPHRYVLDALYRAGVHHFDTASLPEIAQIAELHEGAQCYFMHPVKARPVVRAAYRIYGVRCFAIDHLDELEKVIEETEGGEGITVVVRLDTPEVEGVQFHLSSKFGASVDEAAEMLRIAHDRGFGTGLSFHVGSQCRNPEAYKVALRRVAEVIAAAGTEPGLIDVGGGFPVGYPGAEAPPLEDFITAIREGVAALSLSSSVDLLAEPGRALVGEGCSLLTQVQLRKGNRLYINDGIYGSLTESAQGGIFPPVRLIRISGEPSQRLEPFVINGPTCDSLDVLRGEFLLPSDVREGDWVELDRVGAYSNAMATSFNGFHPETFVEVYDEPPSAES